MDLTPWGQHVHDLYRPVLEYPDDLAPRYTFADALMELPERWVTCATCAGRGKRWASDGHHYSRSYQECDQCRGTGQVDANGPARQGGEALKDVLANPEGRPCPWCQGRGHGVLSAPGFTMEGDPCKACKGGGILPHSPTAVSHWFPRAKFNYGEMDGGDRVVDTRHEASLYVYNGLGRELVVTEEWVLRHGVEMVLRHPISVLVVRRGPGRFLDYDDCFILLNDLRGKAGLPPYVPGETFKPNHGVLA